MSTSPTPAPQAVRTIPPEKLGHLNAALYRAQLRAAEARELEAKAALAAVDAQRAAQAFIALRAETSEALGIALGDGFGWDEISGEVRAVSAQ